MKTPACLLLALALCGCAAEVVREPSVLTPATAPASWVVTAPVAVRLDSGYSRTIPADTRLAEAGSIAQGRVLRPTNTVFTVEGAHMHEAYLVERAGRLVGFYLPVERAFSSLSQPVPLNLGASGK